MLDGRYTYKVDRRFRCLRSSNLQECHQYADDARIQAVASKMPVKKVMLVYNGWELMHQDEV